MPKSTTSVAPGSGLEIFGASSTGHQLAKPWIPSWQDLSYELPVSQAGTRQYDEKPQAIEHCLAIVACGG